MSDAIHDFSSLCANVVTDVAAHLDAGEALASVEHTIPVLRGPHRYAGQAVARALYAVSRHEEHPERDKVHDCLRWLRLAASWVRMGDSRSVWIAVGRNLERASAVIDGIECREQREILRAVVEAVRVSTEGYQNAA